MNVRKAAKEDINALAKIWYDGWQDAHAALMPAELARVRTLEIFRERLADLLDEVRVIGDAGDPLGFSMTKDDELYQLYVTAKARGTGTAQKLITEVEERLASRGVRTAWLACAIGNDRAARFYEKSGWHLARNFVSELPLPDGIFKLEVWRYEKNLSLAIREESDCRMNLRPYTSADLESVVAIFRSNIPKYFGPGEESGLRSFLADGRSEDYFVGEVDGEIVAAGGIALNDDQTVSLCWGMVRADHLGTRLGRALTEFRIENARETFGNLPLVISTSQHTQGFYEKFGFRLVEHTPDGYGPNIDICKMRLEL